VALIALDVTVKVNFNIKYVHVRVHICQDNVCIPCDNAAESKNKDSFWTCYLYSLLANCVYMNSNVWCSAWPGVSVIVFCTIIYGAISHSFGETVIQNLQLWLHLFANLKKKKFTKYSPKTLLISFLLVLLWPNLRLLNIAFDFEYIEFKLHL